ncbi:hypothetical protein [Hymenobacter rubidus]|uniref:hypothetical protein n=1 Tax=Hymenobacter rubidus TaxID=1441626 RepID=UPI00191DFDA3|nr:hypothetical protein [Hymenobacter rubidus]
MRLFAALLVLTFVTNARVCFGQNVTYIGHSTLNERPKIYVLVDKATATKYILDSTRTYITAIDSNGKQLWKTEAHQSNYRVKNPVIVYFAFDNAAFDNGLNKKGEEVIRIVYSNTQFGTIDKKTGAFLYLGQD